jgi:hypothetical protein
MSRPADLLQFHAPVLRLEEGLINHCLPVPDDAAAELLAGGSRRVLATLNGVTFRRAIIGRADGSHMLVVGEPLLREIGVRLGDMVEVRLEADPDPDRVDLCEEFLAVLEQDPEAAARFDGMTPGMQRSLALYVNTAKREETRIRRSLELARKLRTRTLHGDREDRKDRKEREDDEKESDSFRS